MKIKKALETGAEVIGVTCLICKIMLSSAVTALGIEDKIKVKDISEILLHTIK